MVICGNISNKQPAQLKASQLIFSQFGWFDVGYYRWLEISAERKLATERNGKLWPMKLCGSKRRSEDAVKYQLCLYENEENHRLKRGCLSKKYLY